MTLNDLPRTTNPAESWHNTLNSIFTHHHPNPYELIKGLLSEQVRVDTICAQLEGGLRVPMFSTDDDDGVIEFGPGVDQHYRSKGRHHYHSNPHGYPTSPGRYIPPMPGTEDEHHYGGGGVLLIGQVFANSKISDTSVQSSEQNLVGQLFKKLNLRDDNGAEDEQLIQQFISDLLEQEAVIRAALDEDKEQPLPPPTKPHLLQEYHLLKSMKNEIDNPLAQLINKLRKFSGNMKKSFFEKRQQRKRRKRANVNNSSLIIIFVVVVALVLLIVIFSLTRKNMRCRGSSKDLEHGHVSSNVNNVHGNHPPPAGPGQQNQQANYMRGIPGQGQQNQQDNTVRGIHPPPVEHGRNPQKNSGHRQGGNQPNQPLERPTYPGHGYGQTRPNDYMRGIYPQPVVHGQNQHENYGHGQGGNQPNPDDPLHLRPSYGYPPMDGRSVPPMPGTEDEHDYGGCTIL
ncbi:hypothetical protein niasHT_015069 [Heterodera trifolii]|uniref:Uncharacterized protein n=1 Tax=Heterodera trifolii TaxID=157864 RepID=A0ABD2L9I3_9BILA